MAKYLPAACSAALSILATASAQATDIIISDAKVAGGKLVITGTTAAPGSWVRLDGQTDQSFNVRSDAEGKFAFGLVYHPGDCIVDLQRLISPAVLGTASSALVANCGPAGVSPRGAWDASAKYVQNDLVTYEGSTWRARRDNINTLPISGAVWEQFAAAGEPQADGQAGGGEHQAASQLAPPTGPAGGDLAGNYPNPVIRNLRVTTPKLANNAVTGAKILDGTITTFDIAPNAIGSGRLAPNAVVTSRIADGAVTSAKVLDETLTDLDLAANSVGFAEIQTDAVQATEIADNSIDSGEIVDNSLFSADLGAGSVRGSELGTITRRSATSGIIPGNGTNNVGIQCLAGERVLAGGNDASSAANVVIVASRNDGANGWRVFARNLAAGNQTVTVHAYCLQAS